MATRDLITFTTNNRVGAGTKLFSHTPADIQTFAPNDEGFPNTPAVEYFVGAHPDDTGLIGGDQPNDRFDEWVASRGVTPDTPIDFKPQVEYKINRHRNEPFKAFSSVPLDPPMEQVGPVVI
jgi:hypothetical protein